MKVLCIAVERMNEIYPHMLTAAERFGSGTVICGEQYDDPSYKMITEFFATVEKNGPEGQKESAFLKDHADAEVLITFYSPLGRKEMETLASVRIIGSIRGGYQHIDVEEATKRGIAVFNVPGRNAHSVSDFAIALLLNEARELSRNSASIMAGKWLDPSFKTHYQPDLYEKTVGIVGLGAIGRLVAEKLKKGWNMRVLAYDPYVTKEMADEMGVEMVSLETIFQESDFISIHAKATEETRHMISKELLSMMKPNAFLINTSRASLIDMEALYTVLKERRIAGAGLDVMDQEPIPADDPYLKLENVTITGHLAGNSSDTTQNSPKLLVDEMLDLIRGKSTRGLVNPEVLDHPDFKAWLQKRRESVQ